MFGIFGFISVNWKVNKKKVLQNHEQISNKRLNLIIKMPLEMKKKYKPMVGG